jgi:hypothetical protein
MSDKPKRFVDEIIDMPYPNIDRRADWALAASEIRSALKTDDAVALRDALLKHYHLIVAALDKCAGRYGE